MLDILKMPSVNDCSIDGQTAASDPTESWLAPIAALDELEVRYEPDGKILWQFMKPIGTPSVTPGLISDGLKVIDAVEGSYRANIDPPVNYLVLASSLPGIYNLGGDLGRFRNYILAGDRESLRDYAHRCVDAQFRRINHTNLPLCTIALVQGDALGGGFEVALSHDVIVAEESAKFGLPEILFNMFPGMGAFSFLSRRLDAARAQRMISSGRIYSATGLFEMGVVDVIAPDGAGIDSVYNYVETHQRTRNSRMAIARLRNMAMPLPRQELFDIADLWVDTALRLEARDLRRMAHLVAAQNRRTAAAEERPGMRQALA